MMESSNQNNIDINKIVRAGKAIKSIVYTILFMIFIAFLLIIVILNSNSAEIEAIESTYTILGFLGLFLNIFILYSLYKAGDNLENVKLSSHGQQNKSIIKSNMPVSAVSKSNFSGRVELTKELIIIYNDELDKHGLIFSKSYLGKTNWEDAKNLCENYKGGLYSDWRLPNKDELKLFYDRNLNKSNVIINKFWSSNEHDESSAYYQDIKTGYFIKTDKVFDCYVRAVRSF